MGEVVSVECRFGGAVARVMSEGFPFTLNVMSCCRGCVMPEQVAMNDNGEGLWTFAGQGQRLVWDFSGAPLRVEQLECSCGERLDFTVDGDDYFEECDACSGGEDYRLHEASSVLLYHLGGTAAAECAVRAFREFGFRVDWDGSEGRAVEVFFD